MRRKSGARKPGDFIKTIFISSTPYYVFLEREIPVASRIDAPMKQKNAFGRISAHTTPAPKAASIRVFLGSVMAGSKANTSF